MISEKLLNAFLSSRLLAFGLKHINSEVPKVIESHEGNRPDILAYDLISKIPIILELKWKNLRAGRAISKKALSMS